MIVSNMKPEDWKRFLKETGIQDECIFIQPPKTLTESEKKLAKQYKKDFPKEEKATDNKIKVLSLARVTNKAKFFITEDSAFHAHGFWCPDKCLKHYKPNSFVLVQSWFKPNIIEWS